jgi:ribose 5-phosphate isomerase B
MPGTVIIGSDHGGYALKKVLVEALRKDGFAVDDSGPDCRDSCDYPVFGQIVVKKVLGELSRGAMGILVCGTGLGMSITANRFAGIRAAVCTNEYMAHMARAHNDANILCLGERVVGPGLALSIVKVFLATPFEGERHQRRLDLIESMDRR